MHSAALAFQTPGIPSRSPSALLGLVVPQSFTASPRPFSHLAFPADRKAWQGRTALVTETNGGEVALSRLARMAGGGNAASNRGNEPPLWNLPNILTLLRVISIPVLIMIYYTSASWRNAACSGLFVFAAMTDWLDGYLARRMNLSSPLGAFLDPVADKLMVATALVLMADRLNSPIVTVSTAIIICREIGVSALREWMASQGARDTVAVGWWGKVKTATQMLALSVLLYVQPPLASHDALAHKLLEVGVGLLAFSAVLTVYSAVGYVQAAWPALTGKAK
ncbi:hypothetical protein NSK_006406 [Nannochloropsis salina CCMP1776]|uniref:CDP-diacylglycerol--glycerol-3-phosphate 3-phosphatidyltransferase n=1 Tax=Nannochloropsis salina CCMP1776 TaxID=1027361 RepID=A0A4D9CTT9_9STRA|nr:hypothetical protein NSK_006406 [Nannochloropsis salina CCMP1776]|eukprot:TFJ82286.1 hypothetical protein NSK_006406 [Nannochloropsis salina CCMP1776]